MKPVFTALVFGLCAMATAMASPAGTKASSATLPASLNPAVLKAASSTSSAKSSAKPTAKSTAKSSAKPTTPSPAQAKPDIKAQTVSKSVLGAGDCPQDCWNESAADAKCDPNTDDDCLCGPFFDNVTNCVSTTCDAGETLQVLNTLDSACGF